MESKNRQRCIFFGVLTVILGIFTFTNMFEEYLWDDMSSLKYFFVSTCLSIFLILISFIIFEGVKYLMVKYSKINMSWIFVYVYILIVMGLTFCRNNYDMFEVFDMYKAIQMSITVVVFPLLISTLLYYRKKSEYKKVTFIVQSLAILGLYIINFLWLKELDHICYLLVGFVQAAVVGMYFSSALVKYRRTIEIVLFMALSTIWGTGALIIEGYSTIRWVINDIFANTIPFYSPFIGGVANIFGTDIIIYTIVVIFFFIAICKILVTGKKKDRLFYINYKVSVMYMFAKYSLVLFFEFTSNSMTSYWSPTYFLVDMFVVAIIVYSNYDEYDMLTKLDLIDFMELIQTKDVWGNEVGDEFLFEKVYEEGILVFKDLKNGSKELFKNKLGYVYQGKEYVMISPLDRDYDILILECGNDSGENDEEMIFKAVDMENARELFERYREGLRDRVSNEICMIEDEIANIEIF